MRCRICDASISQPNYNSDHDDYEPCDYCLQIINDTVGSWKDRPSADEDELGEDDLIRGLLSMYTGYEEIEEYQ